MDTVRTLIGLKADTNMLKLEAAKGMVSNDVVKLIDKKKFSDSFGK